MTTAPIVHAADDAVRFPSLESLRAVHSELLKRYRATGSTPDMIVEIEAFIHRGKATGALLDAEADRWAAQTQLDYWATQLYRPDYEPPDATLDEFDPLLAPELDDRLCPYVGLDAFHEEDHGRFFGRARLLNELANKLQSVRLLAVVGSSGSGKSSLVRAGLIPLLKKNRLPGSADWFYFTSIVPGSNPLANLARLMLPPEANHAQIQSEVAQFLRDPYYLAKLIRERFTTTAVVVIDQFEEVFTLCTDDAIRQMFVANLITLSQQAEAQHRVIITMRTDFVANVARLPNLQTVFEQSMINVGPLTASELREAIEAPAALIGLKFEEGVVDALLNDTLGEPAALPLLQFTLLKLWENRERNRVTWEAYRRLGGGRLALARTADEFYDKLIHEEQVATRRILLKMVRPGEGLEVTSSRVPRASLYHKAEAADRIDRVLDKLIKARLVRVSEGDTAADDQIEVAHEALVRNWPRLVDWLDEERSALRQRQRLTAAAEQWARLSKDPSALWRGMLLDQARQVDDLNELETEFVQAGVQAEQTLLAAEEARRQKELDDARKLAEAARQRAEDQARSAAKLRQRAVYLVGALGVAMLLGIAAGVFGVQSNQTANASATLAAQNAAIARTAQAESTRAVQQERSAIAANAMAVAANATARSRQLAAVALNQISISPERGLLIALEAVSTADTYEAQDALRQLLLASNVRAVLFGHGGAVTSARYSPDGKQIVTASDDKTARVWDAATGKEVTVLRGHDGRVTSAQYSPDGKQIVTASEDHTARIWDAATGEEVRVLLGHQDQVTSAQYSPDGKWIVTASYGGTVRIWNAATGTTVTVLRGHEGRVFDAQYSPDGREIVTAGEDRTVRIWAAATDVTVRDTTLKVLLGHEDQVFSAEYSPDGKQIVTASEDKTARIWDAATGKTVTVLRGHAGAVASAQYSPDGKQIVTAGEDRTVRIWDAATDVAVRDTTLTVLLGHEGRVFSAQYSPDGRQIVTASEDRTARIWDTAAGKEVAVLFGHGGAVTNARYSPDGKQIVTASDDKTARIWDTTTGQEVAVLRGHDSRVTSAQYSPDGKQIVTASEDKTARIWDAVTGQEMAVLRGHQDQVTSAQYSPDGKWIVTASYDGNVRIWDAAMDVAVRDTALTVLLGHEGRVFDTQYSPDGQRIVTAGEDRTVRIWDAATDAAVRDTALTVLLGHEGQVFSAQYSPDGKQIVTASEDKTARIWDTATGKAATVLRGHKSAVTSAQYSPDGKQIVTASEDRTAQVWDVATGQAVAVLRGHENAVTSAQFSPDGKYIVTASADGTARIYFVHIEDLVTLARSRVSGELTCDDRNQLLGENRVCPTP